MDTGNAMPVISWPRSSSTERGMLSKRVWVQINDDVP